jgi:hypothetical protein
MSWVITHAISAVKSETPQLAVPSLEPLDLEERPAQGFGCLVKLSNHVVAFRLDVVVLQCGTYQVIKSHVRQLRFSAF